MTIVRRAINLVIRVIGMLSSFAMVSLLISNLVGCTSKTASTSTVDETPEPAQTESQTTESDQPTNEAIVIGVFADTYNSLAQSPITLTGAFVPHDSEGDRYRTEFRLGPFSQAVGVTYTDGEMAVDMVMYGITAMSGTNDDFRVYADGPTDQVAGFYRTAFKILDPDVSAEAVYKAINQELELGYGEGLVPDSDLRSMFFNATGGTAECMLDSSSYVKTVLGKVGR